MTELGVLRAPGTVLFGEGSSSEIGRLAAAYGTRVILCTDSYLAGASQGSVVRSSLERAGLDVTVLDGAMPELPLESVEAAIEVARPLAPDCIVALGGGSCIDLAKLIALGLTFDSPLSAFYGEFLVDGPTVPVVAVPTTAGTGSEVTPVAVLSDSAHALKVGISSPHLVPRAAVCDPVLSRGAPRTVTAYAGIDALAHAIEAFTAVKRPDFPAIAGRVFVGQNMLSERFALHAIEKLSVALPRAVADDPLGRADALEGSLCAGLAFASAGTALAHALQYPVGARTATPHGLGVGVLLPYAMAFNASERSEHLAKVAAAMGRRPDPRAAVDAVLELGAELGLPRSLAELGIADADIEPIADQAISIERLILNNPRAVTREDAVRVLRAALAGTITEELFQ